jgi:hypothetical protein
MKRVEIFILILCLLFGFALRFYHYDKKSLWMDEIYTFNDSRDDIKGQIKFYEENPTFLHPPLFFVLTHLFYPFNKPERDLRIVPLIFGTLSIPMIYFLSRLFSPGIALPCALSLTFMAYHISLSQDGRSYSLIMFVGMLGVYFFMKHLKTLKRIYLLLAGFFLGSLIYISYSSISFIFLSQILWFYQAQEDKKPRLPSFFILNGSILLTCLPWILFVLFHYKHQPLMDPFQTEGTGTLLTIFYLIFHDWVPFLPLTITSVCLLILFPFFLKNRRNALVLLADFMLPIIGLYLFCKLFNVTHFITSRYFINFLPLFFISLYLSLDAIEMKFEALRRFLRVKVLFVILLVASNLVILPFYYQSEKQDFRGLANYLKRHLQPGDKIFDGHGVYIPGVLHYLGAYPTGRHYVVSVSNSFQRDIIYRISFYYGNNIYTIYHSKTCCDQYMVEGTRLWIIVPENQVKNIKGVIPVVFKGYFDGSFLNFTKFPVDASMYLFLWDPKLPQEKGVEMPVE